MTRTSWRRCPSCSGVCHWRDTAWVCDECGDEWDADHDPTLAAPGDQPIVIHRTNAPSDVADLCRRWFTYRGRNFAVQYCGPGWGYEVIDGATGAGIHSGYFTLAEVRDKAPDDIDYWMQETLADQTS